MLPYANLIAVDKSLPTPVYLQIAHTLSESIRRGLIPAGALLPGSRALADALGLHRKTVVAAYDELLAQGWLETRASRGTYVSGQLPEIKPTSLRQSTALPTGARQQAGFDYHNDVLLTRPVLVGGHPLAFSDGFPDHRLAPWDAISRAFRTVIQQAHRKNLLGYSDTLGEKSLRQTLADYLRQTRGLPTQTENILVTRGSTMGIYLAAQLVLKPHDLVLVGQISYGSANLIFRQAGAQLVTVPVDDKGLDVDAIEHICRTQRIKMVYVTPHHHYPTTVTMPAERRLRLLQLAQTYSFCILEDDYDYDFHYDGNPVMPLAGADTTGQVIYVGSLCKAIAPALRVGYVAGPAEFIACMGRHRRIVDRQGDNLLEAAVALLFKEGDIKRHLKKAHKTYHQRRDTCCALLESELGDALQWQKPTGGMAIWARFDAALPLHQLAPRALEKGLYLSDGSAYAPQLNATRLGFAALNEQEVHRAVGILKTLIHG